MKRIFSIAGTCLLLISFTLSSCISKGKFLESEGRVQRLQTDSASTHNSLNECNSQVKKLQDEKVALEARNSSTESDLQNLKSQSNMTIAQQAKRLKDLQDLIAAQRNIVNKLKKSIADALVNFKPDELSVSIKDGKVYVSLQEKLLFKSGSAAVDPKGREALGDLAEVLINNTNVDIDVMIEGHTDTVPIHNQSFQDNWALSVARSTAIVRILCKEYALDPHRVSASGRGEFHPVESNESAEGKTSNRRTEIILSPNLSELYTLLGQ